MALLDMIGVVSILPFTAVLTNPNLIETNIYLNKIFLFSSKFGVENDQQFLFILGIFVFITLVISLTFKAYATHLQLRFVQMCEYSIGKRLIEGYLQQPYSWFLDRHSADLGKTILSEVQQLIENGIRPMIDLIAKIIVATTLIALLVLVDIKLALIVGLSLGGAYLFVFYFIRIYLNKIGEDRLKSNELRFRAVSESFGAVKEIKVSGLEQTYIKNFSDPSRMYAHIQSNLQVLAQLPRFVLEAFAFGGILLMILYLMTKEGSFNEAIPIISLYVFAGYRLMPALQQIYASFTQLTFIGPSIDELYDDLKNLQINEIQNNDIEISLTKKINLNNIYYHYPKVTHNALENINLNISANTTVGFIGPTGSGKTTIIDIILGLLNPQQGTLEVNGQIITNKNLKSWQKSIGYVPQNIYLVDDTIASNIAFGEDPNNIDKSSLYKAAKIANIHKFIMEELPLKYQSRVGERGVRLSGGQLQRIGIARALYKNPSLLILDEATSALDNETEKLVMNDLKKFSKDITIIIVAHRLNTLKNCNIIYKLSNGRLEDSGEYNKIINENDFKLK
jgi:ABC-type multidrug transport system fused ATPase/permease subunit